MEDRGGQRDPQSPNDRMQNIEQGEGRGKEHWITRSIPCDWDGWLQRKWKQLKAIFKREGK